MSEKIRDLNERVTTHPASKYVGRVVTLTYIFYYYMTNPYRPGLKKFDWFKAGL